MGKKKTRESRLTQAVFTAEVPSKDIMACLRVLNKIRDNGKGLKKTDINFILDLSKAIFWVSQS